MSNIQKAKLTGILAVYVLRLKDGNHNFIQDKYFDDLDEAMTEARLYRASGHLVYLYERFTQLFALDV